MPVNPLLGPRFLLEVGEAPQIGFLVLARLGSAVLARLGAIAAARGCNLLEHPVEAFLLVVMDD